MKLLIDADACPVTDLAIALTKRAGIACVLVCDTCHQLTRKGVRTIVVDKGPDSTDFRLVGLVEPGDLILTQDYGLAAMCLARRGVPLHPDGFCYTGDNLPLLLAVRHAGAKLRRSGKRTKGPRRRDPAKNVSFCQLLTQLLQQGQAAGISF